MILKVHLDVVLGMRTVNHQNCKCWAFKYIVVLFYILLVRVLYSTTHGNLLKRPWTLVLEGIWVGLIIIMFTYLCKESSIHWYNLGSWSTFIFLSCVFYSMIFLESFESLYFWFTLQIWCYRPEPHIECISCENYSIPRHVSGSYNHHDWCKRCDLNPMEH